MSFEGGGHWYPCFGFLVTSPLGFIARVGSALFTFCGGKSYSLFAEANVIYIRTGKINRTAHRCTHRHITNMSCRNICTCAHY